MDMQIVRRGVCLPIPWGNDTPYYWEGREFNSVTGGWVAGTLLNTGQQSKEDMYMYLEVSGSNASRRYVTANVVDVTNLSKLVLVNTQSNPLSSQREITFRITPNSDGSGTTVSVVDSSNVPETKIEMDVSSVSGSYYITAILSNVSGASGINTAEIFKVWGEV